MKALRVLSIVISCAGICIIFSAGFHHLIFRPELTQAMALREYGLQFFVGTVLVALPILWEKDS